VRVHQEQARASEPVADRSGSEAEPEQLVVCDDSVLPAREVSQVLLARNRGWVAEVMLYVI
jgi:hypothetical protein